eukprot:TRINITY_DN27089_c0_g1_i1.p1 TRINITY_DN27089_c0_g1~~TRINITY_DN27089_c0_g1_i1.p1  ORF type:complete len:185 (-),score=25.07 TRINITY_DN27089_c0_g1_i1:154-708(-)
MAEETKSLWDFTASDIKKQETPLSTFAGKVALVVNTASRCGYTDSNLKELEPLYQKYKDQGFVILSFPCNQFLYQESGTNEQIAKLVCERYKSTYPLFDKINVNGEDAHPLYKFLKASLPGTESFFTNPLQVLRGRDEVGWNFEKFLVDRNGVPIKRFRTSVRPSQIEPEIEELLKKTYSQPAK